MQLFKKNEIKLADYLSLKIRRLYFWVLILLSIALISAVSFVQINQYEQILLVMAKNLSQVVLSDVVDRDILPIAQKVRKIGILELSKNISITDKNFSVLYSADSYGLPSSFVSKQIDNNKFDFVMPIDSDGIIHGYILFNKDKIRLWGPIAFMSLAILLTFLVLYLFITRRIVPGALKESERNLSHVFEFILSLSKELTQITTNKSGQQFQLIEKARKDLSNIPVEFSEVRSLIAVTSEILTALQHLKGEIEEKAEISAKYVEKSEQVINLNEQITKEQEKQRIIDEVSAQVAHDIRSPLSALSAIEKDLIKLPENSRLLLRSAIYRIQDIANDLIQKNRNRNSPLESDKNQISTHLLSSIIDPLVTEKRIQYRSRIGVELENKLDGSSYGIFVNLNPKEFKRVLSNLINNAVEAIVKTGKITVYLSSSSTNVELHIEDNGVGIPQAVLDKLGNTGVTYGKANGSGLGLYHAITTIQSYGGSIDIQSVEGKGSHITIRLPRVAAPHWFVESIKLAPKMSVVILDDDSSIHQIWLGRFESLHAKNKSINIFDFSTPIELKNYVRDNADQLQHTIFLMDYELLGFQESGLELIKLLQIQKHAILVTSRYEEPKIREKCHTLGVRLIPKGMAGFVPIVIGDFEVDPMQQVSHNVDAILIDNDELVHLGWKASAKMFKKSLAFFKSHFEFLEAHKAQPFSFDIPLYVDSSLEDGIKGEVVSKEFFEMGFKNIYLATGYDATKFSEMHWIQGIVGKNPPWTNT